MGELDSSEPFGQRVITGLNEGVSLRLEGEGFKRVLALGSSIAYDVGRQPRRRLLDADGGLAWQRAPARPPHAAPPKKTCCSNYPVPFRHPLLAIAPQPGAPLGALSSQALAVGEDGEVARYEGPEIGWQPESLLNIAGVRQTPQLRAVAWPRRRAHTPSARKDRCGCGGRRRTCGKKTQRRR